MVVPSWYRAHYSDAVAEDQIPAAGPEAAQGSAARSPGQAATGRVDSWIWSVRLAKSRSAASTACKGGHVRVNGVRVKPAHVIRPGDEVRVRQGDRDRIVIVTKVITKRVGAPAAAECYADHSPPPPPREAVAPAGVRDRGAGRPTKRDRRSIDRLLGRD